MFVFLCIVLVVVFFCCFLFWFSSVSWNYRCFASMSFTFLQYLSISVDFSFVRFIYLVLFPFQAFPFHRLCILRSIACMSQFSCSCDFFNIILMFFSFLFSSAVVSVYPFSLPFLFCLSLPYFLLAPFILIPRSSISFQLFTQCSIAPLCFVYLRYLISRQSC